MPLSNPETLEKRRLAALAEYGVKNASREPALDELTALAAAICEAPMAVISVVDEDCLWFKSAFGFEGMSGPRALSFCSEGLKATELFVVTDPQNDPRFAANPIVCAENGIRFYAGAPLLTPDGLKLGSLCVMDLVPRTLTPGQTHALEVLSRQVMAQLELLRRHSREMKESDERSRAIVASALDAIVTIDHEGRITEFNPAAEKIFGRSQSEVLGQDMAGIIVPEAFRESCRGGLRHFLQTGHGAVLNRRMELTALRASGEEFPVELTVTRCGNSTPPIFTAFLRDLSERKNAERALQVFRVLVDQSEDTIEVVDPATGRFLDVNTRGHERLGYSRAEFLALHVWDLDPPVTQNDWRQVAAHIREAGVIFRADLLRRRKDGTTFPIELNARWVELDRPYIVSMVRDTTERNLAEEERRESARFAQATIDALSAHICVLDEKGTILATNRAWQIFAGSTAPVAVAAQAGANYIAVCEAASHFEAAEVSEFAAGLRAILNGERDTFEMEYPCHSPTEQRWFVGRVTRFAGPGPVRIVVAHENITSRKHAEEVLRESEELFSNAFRNSPVAISINRRRDLINLEVNDAFLRLHECSREDVVGRSLLESKLLPPKTMALLRDRLNATGAVLNEEIESRTLAGKPIFLNASIKVIQLQGEECTLSILSDITEQKRTQSRLRRLVESNAQGVYFANLHGKISEPNDAFLRIIGYSREEFEAGQITWTKLTPPEFAEITARSMHEVESQGFCTPYENEYVRKDGSRVPVLLSVSAFEDDPEEGVVFVVDLTERKALEQQFHRAQRLESIGTLAAGIAHDLNNVLGPIMMSIDLLKMKLPDAGSGQLLEIIRSSADHGADMVRQVLSFARGMEGRRIEVQIRHLVRDIEKTVNDTFLKTIQMQSEVANDLWTVAGDPTQLQQVLMNLCVNSRDAMPNGGTLKISANNQTFDTRDAAQNLDAAPGPYVVLTVTDNGAGMPREVIEKIFDPFFTTKEVGKGTGLGLSTSLGIVKAHGGFIRVESEPEKGTTIGIFLPAKTQKSPDGLKDPEADLPRGLGELILIVDDEASVRQITRHTLETFGYRVLLASGGAEAVELYSGRHAEIALVLTDMMMPGMDGPATIHALRTINSSVRIIGASGVATESLVAKAVSLGVKDFLSKPFTARTLLTSVKQLVCAT